MFSIFLTPETYSIASETQFYRISRLKCRKRLNVRPKTAKTMSKPNFWRISCQIWHSLHIPGPGIPPIGSGAYFWSIWVLEMQGFANINCKKTFENLIFKGFPSKHQVEIQILHQMDSFLHQIFCFLMPEVTQAMRQSQAGPNRARPKPALPHCLSYLRH